MFLILIRTVSTFSLPEIPTQNITKSCCGSVRHMWHPNIQKQALRPLKDAAAVNATRYAIGAALKTLLLPVRSGLVA
jgi:hypothetical protein